MFISERGDPLAVPSPTVSSIPAPVPVDNTPLPSLSMIAIKIYGYGGLAFMFGIIIYAILYWFWTVVVKREYADSPPELDLHPERMREREKARIARLKMKKDEKELRRKLREEEKFTPPPLRLGSKPKVGRSRPNSISICHGERNPSTATMGKSGRNRSSSMPSKPAMRKSSLVVTPPRKSSLSSSPSKGKRVSWASSISTLDVNGNGSRKPLDAESTIGALSSHTPIHSETFPSPRSPAFSPLSSNENLLGPIPRARTSVPRLSFSIEPRARRGQEMIAATTPEVALSWAYPDNPLEFSAGGPCGCIQSVDPLDNRGADFCEIHRYKD